MVELHASSGRLTGSAGDDILTGFAKNGTSQIHIYSQSGDDLIHLNFSKGITKFSHGHHVRGDSDSSLNRGNDTFNFSGLTSVNNVVVGRIEDFDIERDTLSIEGYDISNADLLKGYGKTGSYDWRIVNYDSDTRDSVSADQQWLLIDTYDGYVFYALEGARTTAGDGAANGGYQEAHFVGAGGGYRVTKNDLEQLETVAYQPTQDYIPTAYQLGVNGVILNDYDANFEDSNTLIKGSSRNDVIAAGLNDDSVKTYGGNDRVWGGSGNDTINGGNGSDTIYGGIGEDRVIGGSGDDDIAGWKGNDTLIGEDGNDRIMSQTGDDYLSGGNGNDTLFGQAGNDYLSGGAGSDRIDSGYGRDHITGGSGADVFVFQSGDMIRWGQTSGNSVASRSKQLDVITDFEVGTDWIEFDRMFHVRSKSDLQAWVTTIDGDKHFTLKVRSTNERVMVDVEDDVTYDEFFKYNDMFLFT